jgi:YHS domain-containing protein
MTHTITRRAKTYYVSSEGCVYKIKIDSFVRRAMDPVTKIYLSKADAIVGIDADGNLNYFSSWDTLNTFLNSKK